jgi:hypothetical protein
MEAFAVVRRRWLWRAGSAEREEVARVLEVLTK